VTLVNKIGATLVVHKVDQDGNELPGGACFRIARGASGGIPDGLVGDERCGQPATFDGIDTGDYVLVETGAPSGYFPGDPLPFSIVRGETKELTVASELGGSIEVHKFDTEGNPLGNVCFALYTDAGGGARGEFLCYECNFVENTVGFVGIAAGDYVLVESSAPDHYFPAADVPFHIELGEAKSFDVVDEHWSTIVVHKVDKDGAPVLGTCFEVYAIESTVPEGTLSGAGCDFYDENDGTITFEGPGTGTYRLVETNVRFGYLGADDLTFSIAGGETKELTVVDQKGGMLVVHKVDQDGAPLTGTCFSVYTDAGDGTPGDFVVAACDSHTGPDDGTIPIALLATGDYVLVETFVADAYVPAENLPFSITTGETKDVTVVNRLGGVLVVHKVDGDGNPLTGVCFTAYEDLGAGQLGEAIAGGCDLDDGTLELVGFPTGTFVLVESDPPPGFSAAKPKRVRMSIGETREVTIVDKRTAGELLVHRVDETGAPLPGVCFDLFNDAGNGTPGQLVASRCDGFDGSDDGDQRFADLSAGDYVLVEENPPPGFQPLAAIPVRIKSGKTTEVTAENRRQTGALVIRKVTGAGQALPGACFSVWTVGGDGTRDRRLARACDDDDGVVDGATGVGNLPPGDAIVHEDKAPRGYDRAADRSVTVTPGETAEITVEDAPRRGAAGTGADNANPQPEATQAQPTATPTATSTPDPTPAVPPTTTPRAPRAETATATPPPTPTPDAEAGPAVAGQSDASPAPTKDADGG
jgi:uncharacterized surface anchored protein